MQTACSEWHEEEGRDLASRRNPCPRYRNIPHRRLLRKSGRARWLLIRRM
jgi:hypothetical protein